VGNKPLAVDHEFIWLEPVCATEDRSWCQDDQGPCEDCGLPWRKYVRADVVTELCAALRGVLGIARAATLHSGGVHNRKRIAAAEAALAKAEHPHG
jgi:hypothetical protein